MPELLSHELLAGSKQTAEVYNEANGDPNDGNSGRIEEEHENIRLIIRINKQACFMILAFKKL